MDRDIGSIKQLLQNATTCPHYNLCPCNEIKRGSKNNLVYQYITWVMLCFLEWIFIDKKHHTGIQSLFLIYSLFHNSFLVTFPLLSDAH